MLPTLPKFQRALEGHSMEVMHSLGASHALISQLTEAVAGLPEQSEAWALAYVDSDVDTHNAMVRALTFSLPGVQKAMSMFGQKWEERSEIADMALATLTVLINVYYAGLLKPLLGEAARARRKKEDDEARDKELKRVKDLIGRTMRGPFVQYLFHALKPRYSNLGKFLESCLWIEASYDLKYALELFSEPSEENLIELSRLRDQHLQTYPSLMEDKEVRQYLRAGLFHFRLLLAGGRLTLGERFNDDPKKHRCGEKQQVMAILPNETSILMGHVPVE